MDDRLKRRAGTALTALGSLFLLGDGAVSLLAPKLLEPEMAATAYPLWTQPIIGGISLMSGLLYAIPRTTVLGAVLATGFLGGAIATHLRLGEVASPPQIVSLVAGLVVWTGLLLRERVTLSASRAVSQPAPASSSPRAAPSAA